MGMLVRPRNGRVVAGVCAAIANRYGWNVTTVRVLSVLSAFVLPGSQIIVYIVLWVLIPREL